MSWKRELLNNSRNALVETINLTFSGEAQKVIELGKAYVDSFRKGGKLLTFGNGGSAADAQHLAAEFVNRFRLDRSPLPAIALTTDTSVLTSIGNDYDFNDIFKKQIEALTTSNDIVLGISTSGQSPNVIQGLEAAKARGAYTALLAGAGGEAMEDEFDLVIAVPSTETPRIQEVHLFLEHLFCDIVEQMLFGDEQC